MQPTDQASLRDLLETLRRWRPAILGGLLVGLTLGVAAAYLLPRMYRATALITQESSPPVVVVEQPGLASRPPEPPSQGPANAAALAELLRSGTVRDGALARLGAVMEPRGAKHALSHLQVRPVGQTSLVRVTVDDRSPKVAVQAVNAVLAALIDMDLQLRRGRVTETRRAIERELQLAAPRLWAAEDALASFRARHSDTLLANEATIPDSLSPSPSSASPLLAGLQSQLAAQEIELSGLRQQFTDQHPQVIATEARIQETRRRLDIEMARRQQVPVQEREQIRLARGAKEAEIIYQILSEKLQQARITEASIGSAVRIVDPPREPRTPFRSRWVTIALGAVLGLACGLGGAAVREHLSSSLTSRNESDQILGLTVLGSIPLVSVPDRDPARRRFDWRHLLLAGPRPGVAQGAERRRAAFAESFRYLRTNILYRRWGTLRAILVTSPGLLEEREVVAANLAIALAQAGQRVWLLECDLRRPVLDGVRSFRNPQRKDTAGLAHVLGDGMPVEGVVGSTSVSNLWYLPAAATPSNPAELLGSTGMQALIDVGRRRVEFLILHAPPVQTVPDAVVLASAVDGVLLVVNADRTPEDAVRRARDQLRAVGANLLGVVVTGRTMPQQLSTDYCTAEAFSGWQFGIPHGGQRARAEAGETG